MSHLRYIYFVLWFVRLAFVVSCGMFKKSLLKLTRQRMEIMFLWSWEEYCLNVLNAMGQTLTPMTYIWRIWEWERTKTVLKNYKFMVKLNSEFVQMMKNCVFWRKRTQWVRNCVIRAARTINTKKLALNLWKYSIP